MYLYEKLDSKQQHKLISLHKKRLNPQDEKWIKEKMAEYNIIEKAYSQAKDLIVEAISLMESLGEKDLSNIAKAMIEREF